MLLISEPDVKKQAHLTFLRALQNKLDTRKLFIIMTCLYMCIHIMKFILMLMNMIKTWCKKVIALIRKWIVALWQTEKSLLTCRAFFISCNLKQWSLIVLTPRLSQSKTISEYLKDPQDIFWWICCIDKAAYFQPFLFSESGSIDILKQLNKTIIIKIIHNPKHRLGEPKIVQWVLGFRGLLRPPSGSRPSGWKLS